VSFTARSATSRGSWFLSEASRARAAAMDVVALDRTGARSAPHYVDAHVRAEPALLEEYRAHCADRVQFGWLERSHDVRTLLIDL
jgi:hypothetical protein